MERKKEITETMRIYDNPKRGKINPRKHRTR